MIALNHVKIHSIDASPRSVVVEIDGHPVQNLTESLRLEMDYRSLPILTLRLALPPGAPDVDMRALARLDEQTSEALKAMGWTPPESGA